MNYNTTSATAAIVIEEMMIQNGLCVVGSFFLFTQISPLDGSELVVVD